MSTNTVLRAMKAQAWEEAKGKLYGMLAVIGMQRLEAKTREQDTECGADYEAMSSRIERFVAEVEGKELDQK